MFVFIGEGAVKSQMERFAEEHGLMNVMFLPYQPKDKLRYSLNAADVHLVVNQKGIKGVSVPSKIYGVMAAGKAVMGVLEEGSEAHRLIRDSGCGSSSEPQRYDEAADQLLSLYSLGREGLSQRGLQGRAYLERHLRRRPVAGEIPAAAAVPVQRRTARATCTQCGAGGHGCSPVRTGGSRPGGRGREQLRYALTAGSEGLTKLISKGGGKR